MIFYALIRASETEGPRIKYISAHTWFLARDAAWANYGHALVADVVAIPEGCEVPKIDLEVEGS